MLNVYYLFWTFVICLGCVVVHTIITPVKPSRFWSRTLFFVHFFYQLSVHYEHFLKYYQLHSEVHSTKLHYMSKKTDTKFHMLFSDDFCGKMNWKNWSSFGNYVFSPHLFVPFRRQYPLKSVFILWETTNSSTFNR